MERNQDGEKISRNVHLKCVSENGKPPVPIGDGITAIGVPIRNVQRRFYKLRSLPEVRKELAKFDAAWDNDILDWTLNGDNIVDRNQRAPF